MNGHGHDALEREDRAIRGTNDEATVGKYCAVSRGYYRDAFVDAFLTHEPQHFHGPLMNRGHFARVRAIEARTSFCDTRETLIVAVCDWLTDCVCVHFVAAGGTLLVTAAGAAQ